jgi:hypothetical protein
MPPWSGFLQGMREFGYIEGKNFVMEWRFADGKYERFPELAAELVNQTDAAGHDRSGSTCEIAPDSVFVCSVSECRQQTRSDLTKHGQHFAP